MEIKILGSRANVEPSAPYHAKFTGLLIDELLLVDVGHPSFLEEKFRHILFTHLHPDHAYFVRDDKKFTPVVDYYAPEKHSLIPGVKTITEPMDIGWYHITPVPVIHSLKVKSNAYIIQRKNRRIFITGDVAWIEKKYQENFDYFDLVLTDGSWIRKGGMIRRDKESGKIFGHTGVPNLINLFQALTHRIIIIHLGSRFIKDVKQGRKKLKKYNQEGLKVEPAYDGMILKLS